LLPILRPILFELVILTLSLPKGKDLLFAWAGNTSDQKPIQSDLSPGDPMKPLILLALLALTPAALAQHRTFVVAPDASNVKMTLNTNHEVVTGTFHIQSGTIDFDPATPKLSGSVVVLAASGKTGNGTRDKRMDNEILLVEKHATISFEPKSYTGTLAPSGDSTLQVTGIFTLLGTPHEITVPMQVHLEADSAKATTHFIVPYVQWGLKNPSLLIWKAENDVAIDLSLNGRLSK